MPGSLLLPACGQSLSPPPGNVLLIAAHATGTQNYICLPASTGSSPSAWVFLAPQATLATNSHPVSTHFLSPVPEQPATPMPGCTVSGDGKTLYCPTWQSTTDLSVVWGSKIASIPAGTDPSCPDTAAIPCLLLKAVATRKGGSSSEPGLATVTYIQRLNTHGGSAPKDSCRAGALQLVPYTADYLFFIKGAIAGSPH